MTTPGEDAYVAYCVEMGYIAFNGDPLPEFQLLDAKRREAWEQAAIAAIRNQNSYMVKLRED